MKELENKEIDAIRFEFKDGTSFVLDPMKLQHVSYEAKNELDLTISRVFNEIEEKRMQHKDDEGGPDLGVNANDNVRSVDKMR
jgi:hypothetical protein